MQESLWHVAQCRVSDGAEVPRFVRDTSCLGHLGRYGCIFVNKSHEVGPSLNKISCRQFADGGNGLKIWRWWQCWWWWWWWWFHVNRLLIKLADVIRRLTLRCHGGNTLPVTCLEFYLPFTLNSIVTLYFV